VGGREGLLALERFGRRFTKIGNGLHEFRLVTVPV
jgi:hypothetical protein